MNHSNKQTSRPRKGKQNVLSLTQKRQVRQMLSAIIERKSFYYTTGSVSVTTAGTVYKMTTVAQGVTDSTRVGDVLSKKELEIMFHITVGATGLIAAADQYNTVRVIIFVWKQDDGLSTPTVANVLDIASATSPTSALLSYDTRHLYKIIHDEQHVVVNTPIWNGAAVAWYHGVDANYAPRRPIHIPLSGKIVFDINVNVGEGHIYALLISDSAFAPNPTIELNSRFLYDDG